MIDLQELFERVQAATAPDRELDKEIGLLCGWRAVGGVLVDHDGNSYPDNPGAMYPSPTESIDDIARLVEREFPEAEWLVGKDFIYGIHGAVYRSTANGGPGLSNDDLISGAVPALALCAAFLRARMEGARH